MPPKNHFYQVPSLSLCSCPFPAVSTRGPLGTNAFLRRELESCPKAQISGPQGRGACLCQSFHFSFNPASTSSDLGPGEQELQVNQKGSPQELLMECQSNLEG